MKSLINTTLVLCFMFFSNVSLAQAEKEYYENGNIKAEMKFNKKGELNGVYKEYHQNANIKLEGRYKKDLKRGNWKEYDINGSFFKELEYDNSGNLVKYFLYKYNAKGQLENAKIYDANDKYLGYSKYMYTSLGQNNRIMTYDENNKLVYEKIVSYYNLQKSKNIKESVCEYLYKTSYQERKVTCSYYNTNGQMTSKQVNGKAVYTKKN